MQEQVAKEMMKKITKSQAEAFQNIKYFDVFTIVPFFKSLGKRSLCDSDSPLSTSFFQEDRLSTVWNHLSTASPTSSMTSSQIWPQAGWRSASSGMQGRLKEKNLATRQQRLKSYVFVSSRRRTRCSSSSTTRRTTLRCSITWRTG